jgi:hypothetical protein
MRDVLSVLALMVYLAVLFAAVSMIARAASRYLMRKSGADLSVAGSVQDDLKTGWAAIGSFVSGLAGCLGPLIGRLSFLVLGLEGLFFMVWLIKRMWEAA